ncbi:hypothetical protein GCM10009743_49340 [Kribbella swartbergensis]
MISAYRSGVLAYGCGGQNNPIGNSGPPVSGRSSGDGITAGETDPAAGSRAAPAAAAAAGGPEAAAEVVDAAAEVVDAAAVKAVAPAPSRSARRLGPRERCGLCMVLLTGGWTELFRGGSGALAV